MKSHTYMTRALVARDPRFADILGKLGYPTTAIEPEPATAPTPGPEGGIETVRQQARALGIEVDKRWGAARLKAEIAKAAD